MKRDRRQQLVARLTGVALLLAALSLVPWAIESPLTWLLIVFGLALLLSSIPNTPGYCRRCGYDLRASTDRCPECGTRL